LWYNLEVLVFKADVIDQGDIIAAMLIGLCDDYSGVLKN
jgi:hypothetical protein